MDPFGPVQEADEKECMRPGSLWHNAQKAVLGHGLIVEKSLGKYNGRSGCSNC